jgi:hypothetical protein
VSGGRGGGDLPLTYQGEYDGTRTYLPRQVVKVATHPYMALAKILGAPPPDPTNWLDLGGAGAFASFRSTVGHGISPFLDRLLGDLHQDDLTGREYVLTGVAGVIVTDDFDRPDALALGTSSSGAAWTAYPGQTGPKIVSHQATVNNQYPITVPLAAGGHEVSLDWTFAAGGSAQLLANFSDTSGTTGYVLNVNASGNFQLYRNGVQLTSGSNNGGYTPVAGRTDRITLTTSTTGQIRWRIDTGAGTTFDYGVIYLDASPLTANTRAGFATGGSTDTYDNFVALAVGTLNWQQIGGPDTVNTVAASGSALTLPDVTVATIHRVTLTGNCTFTFPTPAAGKSFTLTLVQDGTGSRTATWPASVLWPGGTTPTLTTTAGKADVLSFMADDATNWRGFVAGLNY